MKVKFLIKTIQPVKVRINSQLNFAHPLMKARHVLQYVTIWTRYATKYRFKYLIPEWNFVYSGRQNENSLFISSRAKHRIVYVPQLDRAGRQRIARIELGIAKL